MKMNRNARITLIMTTAVCLAIGENKLRELMDSGELEYIQNGNRRLLADVAIWDWYERAKRKVAPQNQEGGK